MNEQTVDQINKIIDALNSASVNALAQYTEFYFVSALVGICFGLLCLVVCLILTTHTRRGIKAAGGRCWDESTVALLWVSVITGVVGVIAVSLNIATFFAPEAVAINELIRDIRG